MELASEIDKVCVFVLETICYHAYVNTYDIVRMYPAQDFINIDLPYA